MQNEHPVFSLIKTMTTSEKAYFKKYSFLMKTDSDLVFIRIYDILVSQKLFNIDILLKDKKIPPTVKKRIHVSLNSLNKKLISSLLEYRKGNNVLSNIYEMFLEYNLFIEKKLNHLAEKKILKAEKYAIERNIYYQMPHLAYLQVRYLRGNTSVKEDVLMEKANKLNQSINDIQSISQSEIITLKIEKMIHSNKGLIIKSDNDKRTLAILILQAEELLEDLYENLQLHSILTSNLFIMNLMLGRLKDIYRKTDSYLDFYNEKIIDIKSYGTKYDSLLYIKNLSVLHAHFNNQDLLKKCILTISEQSKNLEDEKLITRMGNNAIYLKALNIAINNIEYPEVFLDECILLFLQEDKQKIYYFEILMPIIIMLIRDKKYKKALDISVELIADGFNNRSRDTYLSIRILRAIAWLKLENLQLYEYEITNTYKYLLKNKSFYFNIKIINFLKKFSRSNNGKEKEKIVENLIKEFELIIENGTGTEKMKAIELRVVFELALR